MGVKNRNFDASDLLLLWQSWNSKLNLATLGAAYYVASQFTLVLVFPIYLAFIVLYDIFYYLFAISVIDENETLRQGYNFGLLIDDRGSATGSGLDYGFNFYDGDFQKDRNKAQSDKFDFAWKKLGLKAGMTVYDFGCGCGDWLNYLKTKGVTAVGINITEGQVAACHRRGLDVIWTDWKAIPKNEDLQKRLYGKADAVTMWDTVEHYVPAKHRHNSKKQNEIYTMLFDVVQRCFKKDIAKGRAWTSCLHFVQARGSASFSNVFNNYLLDKMHSGCYPIFDNRQLTLNANKAGLEQVFERNLTEDYYMTSVISPAHFGKLKFTFSLFRMSVLVATVLFDPNWLPRFVWLWGESWMNQFDSNKIEDSPMQLLWIMWEKDMRKSTASSNGKQKGS